MLCAVLAVAAFSSPAAPDNNTDAMEQAVVGRVNTIRREHGLGTLAVDPTLARVARDYSCQLARRHVLSHAGPQGRSVADRVRDAGKTFSVVGENLASNENAPDPIDTAVTGWMQSAGHRANILRAEFTQTGVGVCRGESTFYFTQVFIRPR